MRVLTSLALILLLQACKHPLAIEGEGDIVDLNNNGFGCTLEQFQAADPACENDVQSDYLVNYSPEPRAGWEFSHWDGSCGTGSVFPNCRFEVPAAWVAYWDDVIAIPIPTLTAVFVEIDTDEDGVPDSRDAFPSDPLESVDTDEDGVGDNSDAFPEDPTESTVSVVTFSLDGNLQDLLDDYSGSASGEVTFETENERNYLSIGEDGLVILPYSLSEAAFSEKSFEIAFDFRIPTATPSRYHMLLSNRSVLSESGAGFDFRVHYEPWGEELIFVYGDGQGDQTYEWLGFYNANPDIWHRISLVFKFSLNSWLLTIDGERHYGTLPADFDSNKFISAMRDVPITVGGIDGTKEFYPDGFDLDEISFFTPASSTAPEINAAYLALIDDLNGVESLTDEQREVYARSITGNLYFTDYAEFSSNLMAYVDAYESINPPLYADGWQYTFEALPALDRVLQFSQGYLFDTQFVPGNLDNVKGLIFEHHQVAPGAVAEATPRVTSATVELNGTYNRDVAAMRTDQSKVVRPTGYYLAAGDLVTVKVPEAFIDKGLSVIVGHHFRNMDYDYIGEINRFPKISAEYPLDATEIKLASPFGGGIYLKVLEGINAGIVPLTIENAIQSPFFSWREEDKTSVADWLSIVSISGAPWADFESDKFMFTVPVNQLVGVERPDLIMTKWDEIMDAISFVGGRPPERPRAEYYSFDTRLIDPAYGAQYPLIIPTWEAYRGLPEEGWDPLQVLIHEPHPTLLHEMGHNALHPTMGYGGELDQCHFLEAESIVHMLMMSVLSNVYNLSTEDAFAISGTAPASMTFDQAAFDWIVTSNFRSNQRMYEEIDAPIEDKNQLQYQSRSWAKYGDIARIFGWEGLSSVNAQFYSAGIEQQSTVCDWRPFIVGRDEYIRKASEALRVNMTPLFHFWGINPSEETILDMQQYPDSREIYDLIIYYRDIVAPKTIDDYLVYHNQFDKQEYQWPRYEVYVQQFDEDFAQAIADQFELLIDLYFPTGAPPSVSD